MYELTEDGAALGPAMAALGRWGVERLGPREPRHFFNAGWAMFPLSYMADPGATLGVRETYEFRIDGEVFHLRVDDGNVQLRAGPAAEPDLIVSLDADTLTEMMARNLSPVEAVAAGRVAVEGAPEALQHALALWPEEEEEEGGA